MKNLIIIIIISCFSQYLNGQPIKIYSSDSLDIYIDSILVQNDEKCTKLKFVSYFNDSAIVYYNQKLIYSRYFRPDSSILSTDVDLTAPYIDIPKNRDGNIKLKFFEENISFVFKVIPNYNYIYLYKRNKKLTVQFANEELYFN